jgi:NhaP-type Na+/H+ and K+/H+ antiporter
MIFVVSLAVYVTLGMVVAHPTDTQLNVFGVLDFVVKSTLGAILGLLGAKV